MANKVIKISDISKSYDGDIAVKKLSLSVDDGEFLTLLGPSGCGKTTMLRLLGGFENTTVARYFWTASP